MAKYILAYMPLCKQCLHSAYKRYEQNKKCKQWKQRKQLLGGATSVSDGILCLPVPGYILLCTLHGYGHFCRPGRIPSFQVPQIDFINICNAWYYLLLCKYLYVITVNILIVFQKQFYFVSNTSTHAIVQANALFKSWVCTAQNILYTQKSNSKYILRS